MNHEQLSRTATGGDSQLASSLESMLAHLAAINDRIVRVEDALAASPKCPVTLEGVLRPTEATAPPVATRTLSVAPATAPTLAGSFLNWYTNNIWETVKGKKEQNKRADAKAAVNIMMILYQKPFSIATPPSRAGPLRTRLGSTQSGNWRFKWMHPQTRNSMPSTTKSQPARHRRCVCVGDSCARHIPRRTGHLTSYSLHKN